MGCKWKRVHGTTPMHHMLYNLPVSLCFIASNPCADNSANCSHLCLLSSATPEGYSCACPDELVLAVNHRDCFGNIIIFVLTPCSLL